MATLADSFLQDLNDLDEELDEENTMETDAFGTPTKTEFVSENVDSGMNFV